MSITKKVKFLMTGSVLSFTLGNWPFKICQTVVYYSVWSC